MKFIVNIFTIHQANIERCLQTILKPCSRRFGASRGLNIHRRNGSNRRLEKQDDRSYISFMSKREAKQEQLLDSGLSVMQVHGFNGTSVKDIVEAAGVPKGSFYNYFESKEDFAVQALDRVARQALEEGTRLLGSADDPPLDRLRRFFDAHTDRACAESFTTGCFLGNLGQEMSDSCEAIRAKVQQSLASNAFMFRDVLRQAREQGRLDASVDPEVTAEFLFNAWEGTLLRMKADKSRRSLDAFLEMLPRLLGTT